jgi:DNA invertase Pin-like site-specific DNA recombinase
MESRRAIGAAKTRAALYLRQSLDVQEGIERQRTRCRQLVAARGWDVVEEYADNETSATKTRGPKTAWSRLLADARSSKFDVVVAVDLDRLLRTIQDLITITETGAKVLTVDGEIDLTTADGEFRATMLAGIARFEARRKGERQKRATAQAAAKGRRVGGRRPFGYEQDGVTLRQAEADAIRRGYNSFLSGLSLAAIARMWNAEGFVTGQSRYSPEHKGEPSPWQAYSVRMVLSNPRYMGKRAHLGEVVADADWPAIVEETTWQAVRSMLDRPERTNAPKRGRYLLSGLALCGVCDAPVHAGGTSRPGVRAYRCSAAFGHFARMAEPVERFVSQVIVARLERPDAAELLAGDARPDAHSTRAEAQAVRERLESIAIDFADGTLTSSQLRAATERLRARLRDLESELADAGRVDVLGGLVSADDVVAAWEGLSIGHRRAVIDTLCTIRLLPVGRGTRTFRPETVSIEWKS